VRTPVSELSGFEDAEIIECAPVPADGLGNELPQSATDRLSEVDVAVRFGFGILKGDALTAPQYGILSYHHGDLTEYRGRPAGFHEFIHQEPTAGVTVQRLNESLDGGAVAAFEAVDIGDVTSWSEVLSRLYRVSPDLLPIAVQNCVENATTLSEPESVGDLYTMPSNLQTLKYIFERVRRVVS
jgi:methionyl-tRNA formyltransferase